MKLALPKISPEDPKLPGSAYYIQIVAPEVKRWQKMAIEFSKGDPVEEKQKEDVEETMTELEMAENTLASSGFAARMSVCEQKKEEVEKGEVEEKVEKEEIKQEESSSSDGEEKIDLVVA